MACLARHTSRDRCIFCAATIAGTIRTLEGLPNLGSSSDKVGRLSPRIPGFDYAQEGTYFVTVCTFDRVCLFGRVQAGRMCLNGVGGVLEECWRAVPFHSPGVELDEFIVMPNHIHGMLRLVCDEEMESSSRNGRTIAAIVGGFKAASSRRIHELDGQKDVQVWQRSYYDHVLRSETSLAHVRQYIVDNPLKWDLDEENPE